jgi:GNAT superfamily N-acetyltransferase
MARVTRIRLVLAGPEDATAIATLRNHTADELTRVFGKGHWSSHTSERGVGASTKYYRVYVARRRGKILATLTLQTKKPWAIDVAYFQPCKQPLYLLNMAVDPKQQRKGIGRACMAAARDVAVGWPANAIRLDAYDADAGAGGFYARCGFREVGRVVYRKTPLVYYELVL